MHIEGATTVLDKAALDQIIAETASKLVEDQQRLRWSQTRIQLESFAIESKRLLATVGDKLSAKMKKQWSDELARAEVFLAGATTPGDPKLVQTALASLQKVMQAGAEELYKTAK